MDCLHREIPDFKRKTGDDKVSGPNWIFEGIPPYHRSRRTRRRPRPVGSSRRSSSPRPSEMPRARKILYRMGSIPTRPFLSQGPEELLERVARGSLAALGMTG